MVARNWNLHPVILQIRMALKTVALFVYLLNWCQQQYLHRKNPASMEKSIYDLDYTFRQTYINYKTNKITNMHLIDRDLLDSLNNPSWI